MNGFLSTNPSRVCALLNDFIIKLPNVRSWDLSIEKYDQFPEITGFEHVCSIMSYDVYSRERETLFIKKIRGGIVKTYLFLSEDFRTASLLYNDKHDFFDIREITVPLYQGFRYYALNYGCYMMHSSAVGIEDGCILFCGQSGAGKSTQANLWKKYAQARIISYDQNCLYFTDSDEVMTRTTPWGGEEDYYWDVSCPVRYIVLLEKASSDVVKRLSVAEAFARIYLCNYLFPINEEIDVKNQELLLRIVQKIPTYLLECTKTENAVAALKKEIYF